MATEYKIPKEKLDSLLEEVQGELNQLLKSEKAALAKAAVDDEPAEESSGSEAGAPAQDLEAPAPEASAAPEAPAEAAPEASAPAPEAAPEESAPADEAGAPSLEDLTAAYAELPPEELHLHLEAAKLAAEKVFGPTEATEDPAAEQAAMAPKEESAPAMGKSETFKKSEKDLEIDSLKAQIEEQTKALAALVEALEKPMRKSVKGVSDLAYVSKEEAPGKKAVSLSKAEATKVLREKAKDPSLSKSDCDLIVGYCMGTVSMEKVEHLLVGAK